MNWGSSIVVLFSVIAAFPSSADEPVKVVRKIVPGQVVVPTEAMRRLWGELVSVDLKTRTGTFRKESTDEIMPFNVLPYAELLHHAAFGDLQDFRIGERAIFRMHENAAGEWTWLTYIQDEMNMMNSHKEYFFVDSIDREKAKIKATQANADMSFVREKGIEIETDSETRFWKKGERAGFNDLEVGMKLRTKTHGVGKGRVRMCWEVFLDDESLVKFQDEQKTLHSKRLQEDGAPGYVDVVDAKGLGVTLFQEGGEFSRQVKVGQKVNLARAGADRRAAGERLTGVVSSTAMSGVLGKLTILVEGGESGLHSTDVVRLWRVE
jgi:hypothetical protein